MELREAYEMVRGTWALYKQFAERTPRDDAYWHDFAEALRDEQITKMAHSRFGLDLLHAVKDELERGGHA